MLNMIQELEISLDSLSGKLSWNHPLLNGEQSMMGDHRTNLTTNSSTGNQDNDGLELSSKPLLNTAYTKKGALVNTHSREGSLAVIWE